MANNNSQRLILFLTRSWRGNGGMQQWSRDFDREMKDSPEGRYHIIHAEHSLIGFAIRALWKGIALRPKYLHLGDASLLPLGFIIRLYTGTQLSVQTHGLDVIYPSRLYQKMTRWFLPKADRIVCNSHATANVVRERGVSDDRIVVIPCGISNHRVVDVQREKNLLLTVGRLELRKGIAWFVEYVFPELRKQLPDLRYVIIGDGSEAKSIREIIQKLHLQDAVELITEVDNEARDTFYQKASLFVMPNVSIPGTMEGFGIVCIEAASFGLPVAAARIEGIVDAVVENETGKFFTSGDPDDCIAVILNLLQHPIDSTKVAQISHDKFHWDHIITLYNEHVFS